MVALTKDESEAVRLSRYENYFDWPGPQHGLEGYDYTVCMSCGEVIHWPGGIQFWEIIKEHSDKVGDLDKHFAAVIVGDGVK